MTLQIPWFHEFQDHQTYTSLKQTHHLTPEIPAAVALRSSYAFELPVVVPSIAHARLAVAVHLSLMEWSDISMKDWSDRCYKKEKLLKSYIIEKSGQRGIPGICTYMIVIWYDHNDGGGGDDIMMMLMMTIMMVMMRIVMLRTMTSPMMMTTMATMMTTMMTTMMNDCDDDDDDDDDDDEWSWLWLWWWWWWWWPGQAQKRILHDEDQPEQTRKGFMVTWNREMLLLLSNGQFQSISSWKPSNPWRILPDVKCRHSKLGASKQGSAQKIY